MRRFNIAGTVHTQYRFPIAPEIEIYPGQFYGFNATGQLVKAEDGEPGRHAVYGLERATGDATASRKALCAVSVVVLIPKGTLTSDDRGKPVFAHSGEDARTTDNGRPCGVLLDVDDTTAAIKLG